MAKYGTYIEADAYFTNRLHVETWFNATSVNKTIALTEAAQRIDRLRFSGTKVDVDQDLDFPRYYGDEADGSEEIPNDIKIASYELAYALIDGIDPDLEVEDLSILNTGYSSVRMARSSVNAQPHIMAGIPSASAWRYLLPYLAPAKTIRIHRVS